MVHDLRVCEGECPRCVEDALDISLDPPPGDPRLHRVVEAAERAVARGGAPRDVLVAVREAARA